MDVTEIVLAGLVPARGEAHTPVQVQKLFFLIDRNIADHVGGPHFDFQPYNYGPFDYNVYRTLEALASEGYVELVWNGSWTDYRLTSTGQSRGEQLFESLDETAKDYISRVSEFVRKLSFTQLVSAIYKAYPEMRANSVFQG